MQKSQVVMILIRKPNAPARLEAGIARTQQDCIEFDKNRKHYLDGNSFEFKQQIYGHKDVKDCLFSAQHGKCCYCEGKIGAHDYGDVEHYRPKGAVRQDNNSQKLYPGYYWLVYCWKNLYFSCRKCNQNKSIFFPLVDPAKQARSHHDNIANEETLLLEPSGADNPRNHIKFVGPRIKAASETGQKTIEIIGLNREELLEDRLERLNLIKAKIDIVNLANYYHNSVPEKHWNDKLVEYYNGACEFLDNAVKPATRYSAMATDYVSALCIEASQNVTG